MWVKSVGGMGRVCSGQVGRRRVLMGLLLPGALWLGLGAPLHAATLEGQAFDDTVALSGRSLRLNGLGLRGVAWIKAFVAGLYLPTVTQEEDRAIAMPGPKRLRLKVMLHAPSRELTRSLLGRVQRHEPADLVDRLRPGLDELGARLDSLGELAPGDTLDLDFLPGQGLSLRYNGKAVGSVLASDELYPAVLRIFVGGHPVDALLKQGLMRGGT